MNTTEIFSSHLTATEFDDLPQLAIDRFKQRVLDSVGVLAAGVHAPGIDGVVELLKTQGGAEESSVLYHGIKLPATSAAFLNALMLRSYDFEAVVDELPDGKSEACHLIGSSFPCALATSELVHASGKEMITAMSLGDDLSARLNRGTGFTFSAGWDNTGTLNALGAAAIASKLLKLDAEQTRNALGIAVNVCGGSMDGVEDGVMTFKFQHGMAAKNGVFCAQLAKSGFTGSKDAFSGKNGYFKLFGGKNADPFAVTDQLGGVYSGDCQIKPWPCCRLTHGAIELVLDIMKEHSIRYKDIDRIVGHMNNIAKLADKPLPFLSGCTPQIDGLFNLRYILAVAATQGCLLPKHHSFEYQNNPDIRNMMENIDIVYDQPQETILSCDIDIVLKGGRRYSKHIDYVKGSFLTAPLTRQELCEKFWNNVEFGGVLSRAQGEEIIEAIDHFEEIEDVCDFTSLFVCGHE